MPPVKYVSDCAQSAPLFECPRRLSVNLRVDLLLCVVNEVYFSKTQSLSHPHLHMRRAPSPPRLTVAGSAALTTPTLPRSASIFWLLHSSLGPVELGVMLIGK